MNETVREWIAKAEGDWATASREAEVRDAPNFDAVCFHAQQCIEKLIEGALIQRGVVPPKIHDLVVLGRELTERLPGWSAETEGLRFITRTAIMYRYPGESADREDADKALQIASELRGSLLKLFPIR